MSENRTPPPPAAPGQPTPSAAPTRILVVVVLVVIGVALVVFLPGRSPDQPGIRATKIQWINPLSLTAYPPKALPKATQDDRIGRFLDRLGWGHTDVQNWTARHLATMGKAVADRAAQRLGDALQNDPFYARKLLQLLATVAGPEHLSAVEAALHHDYDFVRMAAVRALVGIDSDEARDEIARLTRSVDPALKEEAYAAMRQAGGLDAAYVVAFLEETADDVLEGRPVEGVSRALRTLAANPVTGAGQVVVRLLDAPEAAIRLEAARTLLAMKDHQAEAVAYIESILRDGTDDLRDRALAFLIEARVMGEVEPLRALAHDDEPSLAITITQLLGATVPELPAGDPRGDAAKALLRELAAETRPRVRLEAEIALYRIGDDRIAQRFLGKIGSAHGNELRDSVQIVAERLSDPRGIAAMRARLEDRSLEPIERSHLLHGLAVYGDSASVQEFIDDIARAGELDEPLADRIPLSYWAAVKIQALGPVAGQALMTLIESHPRDEVVRLALDALRKLLAKLEGAERERALGLLCSIATDTTWPSVIRKAAVESFPFFDDLSITPRLLDLAGEIDRPDVTERLERVLANYF